MPQEKVQIVIEARDQGASKAFDKIRSGATIMGAAVVAAATLVGKAILQQAADFEQTTIAFNTMLGSAEAGTNMLRKLSDFATKTPFTLDTVETGAKQLLAMGIDADNLIPTLKSLGDAAAATNTPLTQIARAYGQVATAGRLQGDELNQFAEAGIPLIAALATHFGVAESAIKGMVSNGEVGFSDVEQAMADLTSEGGVFADMMAAQSTTFLGVMSNIQDTFSVLAREIGLPVLQAITPTLQGIADALGGVVDQIREKGLAQVFEENKTVILVFVGILGGVLLGAIVAVVAAFVAFVGPALAIAAVAGVIGAQIALLVVKWLEAKNAVLDFVDKAKPKFEEFKTFITTKMTEVGTFIVSVWEGIKSFFGSIWEGIKAVFQYFLAVYLGGWILGFKLFGVDIVAVMQKIFDGIQAAWEWIKQAWETGKTVVLAAWNFLWDAVTSVLDRKKAEIMGIISPIIGFVKSVFEKLASVVPPIWNAFWGGLKSIVSSIIDSIVSHVKSGINNLISIINSGIRGLNKLASAASAIPGIGANIPQIGEIPQLADGGNITQGGTALVGERGPELLSLPRGARVSPLGGQGITINITGTFLSEDAAEQVGNMIVDRFKMHAII